MRTVKTIDYAYFTKENKTENSKIKDFKTWERVSLPHTWNNLDGQAGEGDYYRDVCWYAFSVPNYSKEKKQFIEFQGANHVANVFCNGTHLGEHRGGFSTFRFELTNYLKDGENIITVSVDNSSTLKVYPQHADFTFFGGLYRSVNFIEVSEVHFDLMKSGSMGVFITPELKDNNISKIRVNAFCETNNKNVKISCNIIDSADNTIAIFGDKASAQTNFFVDINNPILWDGSINSHLYTAVFALTCDGIEQDKIKIKFGVRTFNVDPDKGFFLNGKSHPLHGVSRHQDRLNKGWAITREDHESDMELIKEVGANTIRLAHYQHDQFFYDLCDKNGMVVWAEIPFITVYNDNIDFRENTHLQMKELIIQNYNHPSICFWGISNEISMGGDSPELIKDLKELNDLTKKLDPSRLTTMAQVMMLEKESEHNLITDVLAYNLYMGWYVGNVHQNGPWFDEFHSMHPDRALGLSEYGAEAVLKWHSYEPKIKDYSEEYQAYYHEQMLETFSTRPYLWGTYVWNMFDFAANARDEGGVKGMNNKGLVTYDRKIKKDSFYAYKSWWSQEKFVHIAGERFVDRVTNTDIKVYSNCSNVTLFINGEQVEKADGSHVFLFKDILLNLGENKITAKTDCGCEHTIIINGVKEKNEEYILPQVDDSEEVRNWFADLETKKTELEIKEGYYSVKDNLAELMENKECNEIIMNMVSAAFGKAMAKTSMSMMGPVIKKMTVESLSEMAGDKLPPNALIMLNEKLNKIKK